MIFLAQIDLTFAYKLAVAATDASIPCRRSIIEKPIFP